MLGLEARDVNGGGRSEVRENGRFTLRTWNDRLPVPQVLESMEVASRDIRKPRLGNPREDVMPVDELEAVDEWTQRCPLEGEASRTPTGSRGLQRYG